MRLAWNGLRGASAGWAVACVLMAGTADAQNSGSLYIVAAENIYGNIAHQLAGPDIIVDSILNKPNQDAHLYEPSPSAARKVATADLVVYNGAGYDPWMVRLLATGGSPGRKAIEVAAVAPPDAVGNPHLWYQPGTIPAVARAIVAVLQARDPARGQEYAGRLGIFLTSLKPLDDKMAAIRAKYAGQSITATEPTFGPMAAALGLIVTNGAFQLAVMNETEPSARDLAAFETDLRQRRVRALIYNRATTSNLSERLIRIAGEVGVPVVPISETMPLAESYQQWIMEQLQALEAALSTSSP